MVRTSRKIPHRWEDYHAIGAIIEGTRIFPFKTPLKSDLQKQIFKEKRFTTVNLLRDLTLRGQTLGLVINCSNTRRYYPKEDIEGMLIEHKEILSPGRGLLIRTELVENFINTIEEFLSRNGDNDLLIGVHCSNGVDRTGFFICNYLICKLGYSSHQALNVFESARGHPIERGLYIQALHKADSDRRLKISNFNIEEIKDKKLITKTENENNAFGLDTIDESAQMLQQFFNIEQQFKEAVNSSVMQPYQANYMEFKSITNTLSFPKASESQSQHEHQTSSSREPQASCQEEMDYEHVSAEYASDEEEEMDDSSPNIDFESMGKIDIKSKSQQRRMRRQRREKMFSVMKRGRFWEINEMRKQMEK